MCQRRIEMHLCRQALVRKRHGDSERTGGLSLPSVYRMIVSINADRPRDATMPLSFAPGEAASY